jgi:superkiller protein 3
MSSLRSVFQKSITKYFVKFVFHADSYAFIHNFIHALFSAKKYEDSYAAYEAALAWLAPTDGQKSHILVAMAAVAYMCQGLEDSKTLLFQW